MSRRFWTHVETTNLSPPVKNNTDRMNQLVRDHRRLTECQKQNRQNEPAGQVDIPTRVEIRVTGDPGHV